MTESAISLSPSRRNWLIVISIVALGICACIGVSALTIGRGIMGISTE